MESETPGQVEENPGDISLEEYVNNSDPYRSTYLSNIWPYYWYVLEFFDFPSFLTPPLVTGFEKAKHQIIKMFGRRLGSQRNLLCPFGVGRSEQKSHPATVVNVDRMTCVQAELWQDELKCFLQPSNWNTPSRDAHLRTRMRFRVDPWMLYRHKNPS